MKKYLLPAVALFSLVSLGCGNKKVVVTEQQKRIDAEVAEIKRNSKEIDELNQEFQEMPDGKLLENDGVNSPIYKELKQRYKDQLAKIKQEVEATGAKFITVIITPEVGVNITNISRYGHPYIRTACNELGIEMYDLTGVIAAQVPEVITQTPLDGHWSKKGAIFLADLLDPIIKKHAGDRSTTTYKDSERPETFGDLPPNSEEILDGGKDLPYKVVANAQGLRMDHNVKFPKAKQHILFLGGSQIYSPFLDNEFITTTILAKRYPNVEMLNSGMISGCTDDYLSLWEEKAKYSEPDVVILQTNGTDITDLFFSNRNHAARSHKPYRPSDIEEKYFMETYRK